MAHKALITNVGRNKEAAALAQQEALEITHIAWGDGDRVPGGGETALLNEQGRKPVQGNGVVPGALNTAFFEILLDTTEGPFTIREAGLFDADGDLIAIARYDPPVNQVQGATSSLIRIHVLFSDLQNLVLQVQGTDAYVPTERKIIAGDGLSGGGDLSADRTLAVDFATEAEAMAGTEPAKVISPATLGARIAALIGGAPGALDTLNELAQALNDDDDFGAMVLAALAGKAALSDFAGVLSNPGYKNLPGDFLIQWGTPTLAAVGAFNSRSLGVPIYTHYYTVPYPVAFSEGPFACVANLAASTNASQAPMAGTSASTNMAGSGNALTGFGLAITTPDVGFVPTIHWIAIGKKS